MTAVTPAPPEFSGLLRGTRPRYRPLGRRRSCAFTSLESDRKGPPKSISRDLETTHCNAGTV
jgi:hypothetical protein